MRRGPDGGAALVVRRAVCGRASVLFVRSAPRVRVRRVRRHRIALRVEYVCTTVRSRARYYCNNGREKRKLFFIYIFFPS